MTARIAVGGFQHETNTFAPAKATYDDFARSMALGGDVLKKIRHVNMGLAGFIDEAEAWAEQLEGKKDQIDSMPLYGIPISIKECSGVCRCLIWKFGKFFNCTFQVKGYDVTDGYAFKLGEVAAQDSALVETLKELGAIPFCLTNLPQSVLSYCCSNPIYGETKNPFDLSRSPGGSRSAKTAKKAMKKA